MKLEGVGLRRLTTGIIIIGVIAGLIAPALELFQIIYSSNKIVIAIEVGLLGYFLIQALILKNGGRWKHTILIGLPILFADIFARIFGLYQKIPGFGYFGHFWTGIALTIALILVYNKSFKSIILFNSFVAFIWEVAELAQDKIFSTITPFTLTDPLWDGALDIGLTIIATFIAYPLIKKYHPLAKEKRKKKG